VIVLNTGLRAGRTLFLVCLFASTALGQSVLNFPGRDLTRLAITNTTPYAADVKFTLYNADGTQATTGVLNPVSRRVSPKRQLSVLPSEIFRMTGEARRDTWIQVSSSVSGLEGFYSSGDVLKPSASGGEAFDPETVQTIPYIPSDSGTTASILVTNPSSQVTNLTLSFYNLSGGVVGTKPVIAIYVAASHSGNLTGTQFVRFDASGALDATFAHDGSRYVTNANLDDARVSWGAITVDGNGRIVFCSARYSSYGARMDLFRLSRTGSLDTDSTAL